MDGGGEARCWLRFFLYYFDGESEGESGEGREAQLIRRGETDADTRHESTWLLGALWSCIYW